MKRLKPLKKYYEYVILTLLAAIIIFSALADLLHWDFPRFMVVKISTSENLFNTLFSVQASVATMSIAIIALIGGYVNKNIFGVSATNYIMQIKPVVLKHKAIIVVNLILLIFDYFAISMALNNLSIAIFVTNITLSIKMVIDIFTVFSGSEQVRSDIKEYVVNNYSLEYLSELNNEINDSIEINNSLIAFEDINLLSEIFEKEIIRSTQDQI